MARIRGGSRGVKEWGGGPFAITTLTTTQAVLATFSESGSPSTILRIRGWVTVKGTPNATGDDDVVGLGIIIVELAAASAGGVSVPGPINDEGSPWIWHQYVPLQAGSAGLLGDDIGSVVRVEIDSKAMRKMGINQRLILVGELTTGEYAFVSVNGGFRALVLHG